MKNIVDILKMIDLKDPASCICDIAIAKTFDSIAQGFMKVQMGYPIFKNVGFNSSPPYMRQWTVSSSAQLMACRLFGAKPLPEPMLAYYELDSWQISVEFESEFYHFD